ncbi:MAG: hypothetical protein ACJ79H_21760 [Myxococcales bacterium]
MGGQCQIEACGSPPVHRVPVFWHLLAREVVHREKGSGRVPAVALVCSPHEHELATGARLKLSHDAFPQEVQA